jgi:nitric oxide reductase subunit B
MTRSQQIAYQFFAQTVVLFVVYTVLALLGAVKFLAPVDPLAGSLPYQQVNALTHIVLSLAVLNGLLGGGLYLALDSAPGKRLAHEPLLGYTAQAWSVYLVVAVLAGLFGFTEGRSGLELPGVLDIIGVALVALIGVNVLLGRPLRPIQQVWLAGLGAHLLAVMVGLAPAQDYLHDRALRVMALGIEQYIAYLLMALALGFWLMHRFSNITPAWSDTGVFVTGGMAAVAGILLTLAGLYPLGAPEWVRSLGTASLFIVPILYFIIAAHTYKGLSSRNPTRTLAGSWFSLGVLLLLLGPGFLGALAALPGVAQWTVGTQLTSLQTTWTALIPLSIALGVINQGTIELRGSNRRVTGLIPFWLVSFGFAGGGLALAAAGVVQVYLERIISMGYLDVQTLLVPLYVLWTIGLLLAAVGAGVYALTFWLRRPGGTGNS